MLTLICGLPGTGKTTLAEALAKRMGAVHLNTDIIRKKYLKKRTYSEEEKQAVYARMLEYAATLLSTGKDVILDATFYKETLRQEAIAIAKRQKNNAEYIIIECILAEDELKKRIDRRDRTKNASEADFEIYKKVKGLFEPIKDAHIAVDCGLEMDAQVALVENAQTEHAIDIMKKQLPGAFIQTHISWLFLTGAFVYKVKKPAKFSFLDFSTLEKRKYYCEQEIELNKRLSPNIYLGIVPIIKQNGSYAFGGTNAKASKPIDYAVKMKQLPQDRKMDELLKRNAITVQDMEKLAGIIAAFHKKIKTIKEKQYASPELVQNQIDDLAGVKPTVEKACGSEFAAKIDFVLKKCDDFIARNAELMKKRHAQGKVKECHGDLHSGNIFLLDSGFCIFDCIEFNKDFRYIDVTSEIAFMSMDLEAYGKEDLSAAFVKEYVRLTQDPVTAATVSQGSLESRDAGPKTRNSMAETQEFMKLLNLFKCYRANVRAKVAALAIMYGGSEGQRENIMKYLNLCERYAMLL